jgi:guanylate kinase
MSSEAGARGQLLVLSAPSGAGKTTLARRFVDITPGARFSISATTRAPRGAERDGVDYHFLSPEDFAARVAAGDFAEWAEVHGRRYGTLRATVEEALRAGAVAVFDIDVQGGAQILDRWPGDAVSVLVVPPSPAELERRLRGRSTESDEAIRARLAAARQEVARAALRYEYVLVNDRIDDALTRLVAISRAARGRRDGRADREADRLAGSCRLSAADLSAWSA